MKKTLLIFMLFLCYSSFSQENWQIMMHDRNANFNEIQKDFNIYYKKNVSNSKRLPKGKGIKQFKRWEYYWENRVDENGNFPKEGNLLEEIKRYKNSHTKFISRGYFAGSGNWKIVGPISSPNNGTGQINGNGRINCITFHPTDPNTIFVGAPSGGFWKSIDGGATWKEYSSGLVRLGVSSIVIDPIDPNIIYIGTGDRDSGDAPGYGVYKSIDGGITWLSSNTGMGNRTVYEILMNPTNSNILIASTNGNRIYKSIDAGANWTFASTSSSMKDIAFKPGDPNTIYASGTSVDVSTDGGATFTQVTSGTPIGVQRIALAVSNNEPDWVYLLAGGANGLIGIYRSIDSGISFSTRTNAPNILGYNTDGSGTASQAYYDLVIAADPTDANIIYTGGVNLWKSTDGGVTMNCVSYWVGQSGTIDGVHADQHALEFSPHTNFLYNGNDGGVYYSSNNGTDWNDISSGLAIAQVYKIGASQTIDNLVINGYQDNGTAINRGPIFSTEIGGDGMECIIDPTNENYMYGALYYGEIRRSTNGGTSFGNITSSISETGAWVTPYKLDPNNSNTMFAGYENIWINTAVRTGSTWNQISNFGATSKIVDLAIAPSNSNIMYVSRNGTNKFYYTNDALAASPTWTNLNTNLPASLVPKDIEIDPNDPNHVFIALGNNIYESTDAGLNWTDISGTLPNISLNTIVIDHSSPVNAMYVGMDVGVYYKDDNLSDWESFSTGLANLEITELEIYSNNTECKSKLYAATYGQGLWTSDLKDPGNIAPTACFESKTTEDCIGNDFILIDKSDYTPTSWSWTITPTTFTYINGTSSTSQNPEIRFTNAGTYTVELTATNANGSNTETKIAYINIYAGTIASNFNEDFEGETLCATTTDCGSTTCGLTGFWSNLTNGNDDDIDWRVDEGGTPSANTGPNTDFNPGTATGNYIYLEASSCSNKTGILESQCMVIDKNYDFNFAYHMFGVNTGSLHIDLFSDGKWQENIITTISGNQGNQWNIATVNLAPYVGKTIKLRIRGITGNGFESDIAIDDIQLVSNCSTPTTWNGTAWSNGTPSLTIPVVIDGNYSTSINGNFECCSLLINSGFELNINHSNHIVVENDIVNNGILNVKNNGSLIQINDINTNIGNINYERTTNIRQQDYVFWSSPIEGFNVGDISPLTSSGNIYKWDPVFTNGNGGQGYWVNAPNDVMLPGNGYIVRGPSNFTSTAQDFTAEFINGSPNNGAISTTISRGNYTGVDYSGANSITITRFDDNWNLIGNPYPSSINVIDFLNLNSSIIEGSVRIWTHGTLPSTSNPNPFYGNYTTNYSLSDFIVHNGTGTVSGPNGFNGFIAGGQGFMVLMNDGATASDNIIFNNSLRNKTYTNDQFYKTSPSSVGKNRIWLNLSNENADSDRTLIGYLEEATNSKDRLYDAFTKVEPNAQKIYTFIGSDKMTIQAFGLPFSDEDTIPLGINTPTPGNYTISIHAVDGFFTGQQIFVEDTFLNTINNISNQPYSFYSEANEINDRFILRFNTSLLSNIDFEVDPNDIIVSGIDQIEIESKKEKIKNIVIYDVLGRKVLDKNNIDVYKFNINSIIKSDSALLMKITLSNNQIAYKKFLF